jgi:hydrogenase maturation protease
MVRAAVIGIGNEFRKDDGIGPAVIAQLEKYQLADVSLTATDGEPTQLLDAWSHVPLAIVIDAVLCDPSTPGRIHRTTVDALRANTAASTHGLGIPDAVRLADVLDRTPGRLVIYAVEAADLGFGLGLSAEVVRAVPELTRAVLAELGAGGSA